VDIGLDFHTVREDPREIEYAFGAPSPDRRLVIVKRSRHARVLDGGQDADSTAAMSKILRIYQASGFWPTSGSYHV
jgi:hypothetical protein